jgi:hypothetical protein
MGTASREGAPREPTDEDELGRLPPLDGDAGDAPEPPVVADDDLAASDEGDAEGALDDSTPASAGQHPDVDAAELVDSSSADRGWLDEANDNQALDIGGYDLAHGTLERDDERSRRVGEGALSSDEADDRPEPDDDFAAGERADALDPAAEDGPVDADEELREEDLPALDADEHDGGGDDVALLDERLARGESNEPVGLPWSAAPWTRVGAPVGLRGVTALACVPRGALVASQAEGAGSTLLAVDLEGTKQTVRADGLGAGVVRAIASRGSVVAILLQRSAPRALENGHLFFSRNVADSFETLRGDIDFVQVALTPGHIWATTRSGGLVSVATAGAAAAAAAFVRHEVPGNVWALSADGAGGIVALAADAGGRPVGLIRGAGDGSIRWEGIELPSASFAGAREPRREPLFEPLIAARGSFVAMASGGEVLLRRAGGAWQRACWDGGVTAMAFVDDAGTLLAATYSQVDATTVLVAVGPSGRPAVVGLVGGSPDDPDADGRALALACDDARGVVWLAGGFGIAAFARPSRV